MQFGKSSEKLDRQIEQLELALEELEAEAVVADERKATAEHPKRPSPVRALPPHLPREDVVHEPTTGTCACPSCGGALRLLGRDTDELLDVAPISWRVVRHIRPKYSCRGCEAIVQAPVPAKACPRGKATFATLAHVIVAKFDHHLPLYRQSEMMAAQGLDIDRSTLAGWTGQAAALLDPIVSGIREEGVKATKLHTEDTPVPMLDRGRGRGRTATGRRWAKPAKKVPAVQSIVGKAAERHFRRQVFDVHQPQPTPLTTDLLERIGALYTIEKGIRGQPPTSVHASGRNKPSRLSPRCAPPSTMPCRLSPAVKIAKACRYGLKLWPALTRFLDNGRLEIDNNIAERAIRSIAVDRRNWRFAGSPRRWHARRRDLRRD